MENKRTCLYDKHVALGALMSPFGGFEMPIQYSGIVDAPAIFMVIPNLNRSGIPP